MHYTYVFQIFVFMQLFNQINARKIMFGEINVFAGFFQNAMFLGITLLTFAVQMTMVEIGGVAIQTWPLNTNQNLICISIGFLELIWGLILKFIPLRFFQIMTMDDQPAQEEEKRQSNIVSRLKASSQMKKTKQ